LKIKHSLQNSLPRIHRISLTV